MGTVKTESFATTHTFEAYRRGTKRIQSADEVAEYGSGTASTVTLTDAQKLIYAGERTWCYIKATAAIDAGDLVVRTAIATDAFAGKPSDVGEKAAHNFLGVADHAIASGSYGWVICKGPCVVLAHSDVDAGEPLSSDGDTAAGSVGPLTGSSGSGAGAGNTVVAAELSGAALGVSIEAEGASAFGGDFVMARIDIPA